MTLEVETETGPVSVQHELIMNTILEWKLSEFFRAIGQKKRGEPLRPRWNEVPGARGRARFKPRAFTKRDGSEGQANHVERFYDYDPALMAEAAKPAQADLWKQEKAPQPTPWDKTGF